MKRTLLQRRVALAIAVLAALSLGATRVLAQEWYTEYVPFVEEGKVWYCGYGLGDGTISPGIMGTGF